MRARDCVPCVLALLVLGAPPAAGQRNGRGARDEVEERLRREGDAVIALADAAARGEASPSDFALGWHNDFLKAQAGTFIPFVVTIAAGAQPGPGLPHASAALLYVRAVRAGAGTGPEGDGTSAGRAAPGPAAYPFEGIYPVSLAPPGGSVDVSRGFWLPAGEYDVTVVVREREGDSDEGARRVPKAAVLGRRLTVPAFDQGLATSTIMVADRLTELAEAPPSGALSERPYVIGVREIHPRPDAVLPRNAELIVVFLIYNAAVTFDRQFDLEVEYHFFRKTAAGEIYVNRTEPQRFTPAVLGARFDPSLQPVLAGQGVPLSGFEAGNYTLRITVADRISGQAVEREAAFTVGS